MIRNYILIVGAMKSGTTTLFDILSQHPQISPCRHKEPGFFAFEDRWAEGFEWYESLYDFDKNKHIYAMDGSTDYTKYPFCDRVIDRLKESFPREFKIIYIIRDPIDRIQSHARHVQLTKKKIGQMLSPRMDHSFDCGISPVSIEISKYYQQILRYYTYFNKESIHILKFEDLISNQEFEVNKILNFLDLKSIKIEYMSSNSFDKKYYNTDTVQFIRDIKFVKRVSIIFPKRVKSYILRKIQRKVNVNGRFHLNAAEKN